MTEVREPPPPIPVIATVRTGGRVVIDYPRRMLFPIAAVHIPVAIVLAIITLVVMLTVFGDEPVDPLEGGASKGLFLFLSTAGAWVLFSQVARGAAIRAAASVMRKEEASVADALDPAFTRMGGLIALAMTLFALAALVTVPVIGWILAPYLTLRIALAFEVFMIEDTSPLNALRRSWELTRGRLLRLLGVLVLSSLTLIGPLALLSVLSLAISGGRTQQLFAGAGYSIVQGVLIIPVVAFITAVTTAFYLQATGNLDVERDV